MASGGAPDVFLGEFKVVLLGDGGVGKSTYLKRLMLGEFEPKYVATMGVEVVPLHLQTTAGKLVLKIWDCSGRAEFGGMCDGYLLMAKAAILMFDLTSKITLKNIDYWYQDLCRVNGRDMIERDGVQKWFCSLPVVMLGNKADVKDRKVTVDILHSWLPKYRCAKFAYADISARNSIQIEYALLILARKLTGIADLELA